MPATIAGRSLVAYTYDVGGNRTGLTDLTGKRTEYEYDYADRLRKVYDNGNCQACYTYNPDGTMKALEIGGNSGEGVLYTEYIYDRVENLLIHKEECYMSKYTELDKDLKKIRNNSNFDLYKINLESQRRIDKFYSEEIPGNDMLS